MSKDVTGPDLAGQQDLPARVEEFIGNHLREVDEIYFAELASANPYVCDVLGHVTRFRGKRLRPMLLLLSAAATGRIQQSHKTLAAVVEMIHSATLVHDDVLDDAETRRHVATVNARWNNETSVLFGDYLFTHAFHLASTLETTHACRTIGRATNVICEGELSQIRERGNLELGEEKYLQIINGKTAELCAVCCLLGAHYAGGNQETIKALESYGRNLGIAFQIADDLLDILGSESETGKSLGSDFVKQKLTLPLIRLLEQADERDAGRIRELLSVPNAKSWEKLLAYLSASDALEYTRAKAQRFATAACESLAEIPNSPGKHMLIEIAEFSTRRAF